MSSGRAEKNLECSICLNYYDQPKQLPCHDTFCLSCLKTYCFIYGLGDTKACPLCRQEFTVPLGGVEMLPDNQVLTRLSMETGTRKRKLEIFWCEICEEVDDEVKADTFCMECKQCLCERCKTMHSKIKATANHKLVGITKKPSEEDLDRMESAICDEHDGEEYKLYCCECSELLCYSCHATEHYKHKCMTLLDAAESRKDLMKTDYASIERCRDDERNKHKEQLVRKERFLNQTAETQKLIESHCDKLIKEIQAHKSDLMKALAETKEKTEKDFHSKREAANILIVELDGFLKYSRMVMDRGTDCDTIRVADELQRKAQELIKSQEEHKKEFRQDISVTSEVSTEKCVHDIRKVLEQAVIKDNTKRIDMEFEQERIPLDLSTAGPDQHGSCSSVHSVPR